MSDQQILCFQPRVMRHRTDGADEEFAVHDVYFGADGRVVTYTEDALSPRRPSVESLRAALVSLLEAGEERIVAGDLGYVYTRSDIADWIHHVDEPPIDFEWRLPIDPAAGPS